MHKKTDEKHNPIPYIYAIYRKPSNHRKNSEINLPTYGNYLSNASPSKQAKEYAIVTVEKSIMLERCLQ